MAAPDNVGHEAVNRLFELSRDGATDDGELGLLDSLVYDRLVSTYDAIPEHLSCA